MSSSTPINQQPQPKSSYLAFSEILNPVQEKTQSTASSSAMAQPATKKYLCGINGCDRSYDLKNRLTNHVKSVHEGMRYPCTFEGCSQKFTQSNDVNKHINSVHKKQTYLCDIGECNTSFSRFDNLTRHKKRSHGI